jgi:hypothetical protein
LTVAPPVIPTTAAVSDILKTVNIPNCENLNGESHFASCVSLEELNCPKLQKISKNFASGCKRLKNLVFPVGVISGINSFSGCADLEYIEFGITGSILGSAFQRCENLKVVVLRGTAIHSMVASNAFSGTPFASDGTGGTVYCPAALISEYQAATNWSTLYAAGTCNFVAIEGSEYE